MNIKPDYQALHSLPSFNNGDVTSWLDTCSNRSQ